MKVVIIDIDGCLANVDHRLNHIQGSYKDWKSFNEAMVDDPVNTWCKNLILRLYPKYEIILVTAREGQYRDITKAWLIKNNILYNELYMRDEGDHGQDDIYKEKVYFEKIKPREVEFVIEDRKRCVDMWRGLGLTCLTPADGNF